MNDFFQAESGMESLFWGRTDYQDLNMRTNQTKALKNNQWPVNRKHHAVVKKLGFSKRCQQPRINFKKLTPFLFA